jgi:hypothetical protein
MALPALAGPARSTRPTRGDERVDPPKLPRPRDVVQKLPVVEAVVVRAVALGVVRRREDRGLVAVDGVKPEEELDLGGREGVMVTARAHLRHQLLSDAGPAAVSRTSLDTPLLTHTLSATASAPRRPRHSARQRRYIATGPQRAILRSCP